MADIRLRDIPWETVDTAIRAFRVAWFTREKPDVTSFVVSETVEDIEDRLRRDFNYEGSPYSYNYEGEILNLRRPEGVDSDGIPMEHHIRGFEVEDGVEMLCQLEPSRYEAKEEHLSSGAVDWEAGKDIALEVMKEAGFGVSDEGE